MPPDPSHPPRSLHRRAFVHAAWFGILHPRTTLVLLVVLPLALQAASGALWLLLFLVPLQAAAGWRGTDRLSIPLAAGLAAAAASSWAFAGIRAVELLGADSIALDLAPVLPLAAGLAGGFAVLLIERYAVEVAAGHNMLQAFRAVHLALGPFVAGGAAVVLAGGVGSALAYGLPAAVSAAFAGAGPLAAVVALGVAPAVVSAGTRLRGPRTGLRPQAPHDWSLAGRRPLAVAVCGAWAAGVVLSQRASLGADAAWWPGWRTGAGPLAVLAAAIPVAWVTLRSGRATVRMLAVGGAAFLAGTGGGPLRLPAWGATSNVPGPACLALALALALLPAGRAATTAAVALVAAWLNAGPRYETAEFAVSIALVLAAATLGPAVDALWTERAGVSARSES